MKQGEGEMGVRGLDAVAAALSYAIATNCRLRERISREKKAIQDADNATENAAQSCAVKAMYVMLGWIRAEQ